jgi:hypothetical protein
MLRLLHNRFVVALLLAAGAGTLAARLFPFLDHPALTLIHASRPDIYAALWWVYYAMLYTSPFFLVWGTLSLGFTFSLRVPSFSKKNSTGGKLPALVPPSMRDQLTVVLGEVHHPRLRIPSETPQWLWLPAAGLHTGIILFGAVGTGKTSTGMYPFCRQAFGFAANDKRRKCAGLILEVKGTFCHDIKQILEDYGRAEDYIELALDGNNVYNPLLNNLEPYEQAATIANLLNAIFGKGKDPFWQAAYTNLISYAILLYRAVDGYVTFYDLYESCTNSEFLGRKLKAALKGFAARTISLPMQSFMTLPAELQTIPWTEMDDGNSGPKKPSEVFVSVEWSRPLEEKLTELRIKFVVEDTTDQTGTDPVRRLQLFAVDKWYEGEWSQMDAKLQTSIVASVSPFLGIFNQDPQARRVFCPPAVAYNETKNPNGSVHGKPIWSMRQLIEQGQVLALNFPIAKSAAVARSIGMMVKKDFQRAMLERIPDMKAQQYAYWRSVVLAIDECHMFCGDGDAEFLSLSRESRCIPILATQSISSLRTQMDESAERAFLQTLQTTIFLRTKDEHTATLASKMCGREDRIRLSYNIGESGSNAKFSALTGTPVSGNTTLSTGKAFSTQKENMFEPKEFLDLRNAEAIVMGYDGFQPIAATRIYLKPYYLPGDINYFEQVRRGMLAPAPQQRVA